MLFAEEGAVNNHVKPFYMAFCSIQLLLICFPIYKNVSRVSFNPKHTTTAFMLIHSLKVVKVLIGAIEMAKCTEPFRQLLTKQSHHYTLH